MADEDPAVWSPLYTISGTLETTLPQVFAPDYPVRLEAARERLRGVLGDGFLDHVAERRRTRGDE